MPRSVVLLLFLCVHVSAQTYWVTESQLQVLEGNYRNLRERNEKADESLRALQAELVTLQNRSRELERSLQAEENQTMNLRKSVEKLEVSESKQRTKADRWKSRFAFSLCANIVFVAIGVIGIILKIRR